MLKFNINNYIYFKPTEYAKSIYFNHHSEVGKFGTVHKILNVNAKGFSKLQGWEFMKVFGDYMTLGGKPVIEGCEIYIEEDKLEEGNV